MSHTRAHPALRSPTPEIAFLFFSARKNGLKFENPFGDKFSGLFVRGNKFYSFLKGFHGSLFGVVALCKRCVDRASWCRGVYPLQPTMQTIVTKIRAPKRLKKALVFLTVVRSVWKDFLNFSGKFVAIFRGFLLGVISVSRHVRAAC
jgi:hypothetical protein